MDVKGKGEESAAKKSRRPRRNLERVRTNRRVQTRLDWW